MSMQDAIGGAIASAAAPAFVAAFGSPPLPPELGLAGQISDEQVRAQNANAWSQWAPWLAGLVGATVGWVVGASLVQRRTKAP